MSSQKSRIDPKHSPKILSSKRNRVKRSKVQLRRAIWTPTAVRRKGYIIDLFYFHIGFSNKNSPKSFSVYT